MKLNPAFGAPLQDVVRLIGVIHLVFSSLAGVQGIALIVNILAKFYNFEPNLDTITMDYPIMTLQEKACLRILSAMALPILLTFIGAIFLIAGSRSREPSECRVWLGIRYFWLSYFLVGFTAQGYYDVSSDLTVLDIDIGQLYLVIGFLILFDLWCIWIVYAFNEEVVVIGEETKDKEECQRYFNRYLLKIKEKFGH